MTYNEWEQACLRKNGMMAILEEAAKAKAECKAEKQRKQQAKEEAAKQEQQQREQEEQVTLEQIVEEIINEVEETGTPTAEETPVEKEETPVNPKQKHKQNTHSIFEDYDLEDRQSSRERKQKLQSRQVERQFKRTRTYQ